MAKGGMEEGVHLGITCDGSDHEKHCRNFGSACADERTKWRYVHRVDLSAAESSSSGSACDHKRLEGVRRREIHGHGRCDHKRLEGWWLRGAFAFHEHR